MVKQHGNKVMYKKIVLLSLGLLGILTTSFTTSNHQLHADCLHHNESFEDFNYDDAITHVRKIQKLNTVVIDAGHGGKDSGCRGTKSKEKHVTLKIALKLGKYIEDAFPGVVVIYTRKKDVFIPLHKRAEIANKNKADLFISIHCNATAKRTAKHKKVNGTETYVMGLHKEKENLEVAKRENQSILLEKNYKKNYGGFDPNSPEGHIMLSMYQHAFLDQSINFASKIEKQFKARAKRKSRGVKQAGFVVLRRTAMPSVLIEAGFLTNNNEEKFLSTAYGQNLMASAIFRAFKEYKNEISPAKMITVSKGSPSDVSVKAPKFAKGIVYKVQLGASSKLADVKKQPWTKVKQLEVQKISNSYKYLVGEYNIYTNCAKAQKYWKKNGFKDAFIVAYQDGKRISVAKAKKVNGK